MKISDALLHARTIGLLNTKSSLLRQITNLYVSEIPVALAKVSRKRKLYGALLPCFGQSYPTQDKVEMSCQLWTLDVENQRRINSQYSDPKSRFYHLFSWAENVQRREVEIASPKLKRLLYRWYLYQDANDSPRELIGQIGAAVSAACIQLNTNGWANLPVSNAFVLYTECCSDDGASFGLEHCATLRWQKFMEQRFGGKIRELIKSTLLQSHLDSIELPSLPDLDVYR